MSLSCDNQYEIKICNGFTNSKIPGASFSKSKVDRWGNPIKESNRKHFNGRGNLRIPEVLSSRGVHFHEGKDANKWDTLYYGRVRKMNKRIVSQENSMTFVPEKITAEQVDMKNNLFKPKEKWTIADGWAYRPRPLGNVVMEIQAREEARLLNSKRKSNSVSTILSEDSNSFLQEDSEKGNNSKRKEELLGCKEEIESKEDEDCTSKASSETSIDAASLEESLMSKYSNTTSKTNATSNTGIYSCKSDRTNPLQWLSNGPAGAFYKKDMLADMSPGPKYYTRDQSFDSETFDKSKAEVEIEETKLREPKFWKNSGMGIGDRFGGCNAFVKKPQAADSLFYPSETQTRKTIPACTTITTRRTAAGSIYGDLSRNVSPGPKYNILPIIDKLSTTKFHVENNCFAPPTYAHESLNNDPLPENHADIVKYGGNLSMGSLSTVSMVSSSKNKYLLHSPQRKSINKFLPIEEEDEEDEDESRHRKEKKEEIVQTNDGFFNKSNKYDWKTIYLDCDEVSSYHAARKGATNPPQTVPGL